MINGEHFVNYPKIMKLCSAHLGDLLSSFHVLPSSSGWLQHGLEAAHNHPRLKSCLKTTPAQESFRRARLHPESSSPGVTTTETKTSARPFCFQTLTGHYSHERSDLILQLQPGMSGQSSSCTRSTFSENISCAHNRVLKRAKREIGPFGLSQKAKRGYLEMVLPFNQ